jgi:protein required for attachment to host cells
LGVRVARFHRVLGCIIEGDRTWRLDADQRPRDSHLAHCRAPCDVALVDRFSRPEERTSAALIHVKAETAAPVKVTLYFTERARNMSKQTITWIIIADGEHARIVVAEQGRSHVTLRDFLSPTVHESSHDLGAERPGRTQESATAARHAIQPRSDPHEQAKHAFAKEVAMALNKASVNNEFDHLVLVAQPRVAASLRAGLGEAAQRKIVGRLEKDLTKVPDRELARHLDAIEPIL